MRTFEQFMEHCLHDPVRGYYSRNIGGIGARGDFTTAPQLSAAPAKAIAAWASRALRESGCRHLIEIGPGLGTLAKDVLRHLPLLPRLRTRLHLVESSPALSAHQKALLGENNVSHHTTVHQALAACSGTAVIYSNELVDAFPVRLFEKQEPGWQEIAVEESGGQLRETFLAPATLPPSSVFSQNLPSGQRVEVHESYRRWLESWLPLWHHGEMLTIDYGDTVDMLYHRRPRGSLRAYLLHQRLEGPAVYQNPGLQDLTADVNFTDLAEWAEPWLESEKALSFADFLRPFTSAADAQVIAAGSFFLALRQRPHNREPLPAD